MVSHIQGITPLTGDALTAAHEDRDSRVDAADVVSRIDCQSQGP